MKYLLAIITGIFLVSCSSNTHLPEDAIWLQGNWIREYNGIAQMEKWQFKNGIFTGENLFVSGDTNIMNIYELKQIDGSWQLTKKVTETDIAINYTLVSSVGDSLIFRNPKQIWPQELIYKKLGDDKMEISMNGQDGTMRKSAAFTFDKKN